MTTGTGQTIDEAGPDWIDDANKHNGNRSCRLLQSRDTYTAGRKNGVGAKRDQFRRLLAMRIGGGSAPACVDSNVAAVDPARLGHRLYESFETGLTF